MFDSILKLVIDTTTVYYQIDNVCNHTAPVECQTIMSVAHDEKLSQLLFLLETKPGYAQSLYDVNPEIDLVLIESPRFCHTIAITADLNYSLQPTNKEIKSILSRDCLPVRSTSSYIATINSTANKSLKTLAQEITKNTILINHNLQIEEINSNLVFVYNADAEKNIILNKNYWEYITLLISREGYNITIILDGSYGTGFNPPHISEFRSSVISFRDEIHKFFLRLKESI